MEDLASDSTDQPSAQADKVDQTDPIKSAIITDEEYEDSRREIHATIDKEEQAALAVTGESAPATADARPAYATHAPQQWINNAYLLEVVGGLFGMLGLGYMYSGRHESGITRLLGWWVVLGLMWGSVLLLSMIIVGICLIPLALLVQVLVPIWSASNLKQRMLAEGP